MSVLGTPTVYQLGRVGATTVVGRQGDFCPGLSNVDIIARALLQEEKLPLYEYRCQKCGAVNEKIQKFSDPPLKICEKCGGKLERLVSSSAIQFKGSGWYVTDYARKSSPGESSSPPSSSSSPSTSEAKKEPAPTPPKPSSGSK